MSNALERQVREIRDELQQSTERGQPCPECGYGSQLVILTGDEPEPTCIACGQPQARGEDVRIIRIVEREDGPR